LSEEKLFEIFKNNINFQVDGFLVNELTSLQEKIIDDATFIFKDNIIGELKVFGGNIKKNEDKYKELKENIESEIEKEKYKVIKKDLKEYLKLLPELILKTCVAEIPVKELPWEDVIFRTIPRILRKDTVKIFPNKIAYYGYIKCKINKSILFGRINGQDPFFAPLQRELDLKGAEPNNAGEVSLTRDFQYVDAIMKAIDDPLIKLQLSVYEEKSSKKGDAICDYLNQDGELLGSMSKLKTNIDVGASNSGVIINAIAIPSDNNNTTLVIVLNDENIDDKYLNCFEAFLKFSTTLCQMISQQGTTPMTEQIMQDSSITANISTEPTGQPDVKVWTAEELAKEAQKRLHGQPNIPVWTEEELAKIAQERQASLPEGLEMWTEEELLKLAEERESAELNLPKWEEQDLPECKNCGYALRPGWARCPICNTPVENKTDDNNDNTEN